MPKISVVPTDEVMKISEDQGMLPERYIGGIEKTIIPNELRYKDSNGNFLHDLKITRNDGSSFSIHEVESECENLPKFIISDYGKKSIKRYYAYTNDIDLVRLQNDKNYLYAFSEQLFSKDRIESKKQISLKNNNNEYIYLGGLKYDYNKKCYVKVAKRYKEVEDEIETQKRKIYAKIVAEEQKQKKEKNELIGNIAGRLVSLDIDDLKKLANKLGL